MLFKPFTFPNGTTTKNRFFKSAMEEHLAHDSKPTDTLVRLYDTWAKGGAGVLVTGNVMVNKQGKGSVNDVVADDESSLPMLKKWANAGKQNDTLIIMQINHAGKQSPKTVNAVPVAPSVVPLVGMDGFINPPRALQNSEIHELIQAFINTAKLVPNRQAFMACRFIRLMGISSVNFCRHTTTAVMMSGAEVLLTV